MDSKKLLNKYAKLVFTDGRKGDNVRYGTITWVGEKYLEINTKENGRELIPHHSIIRIEIKRDNSMDAMGRGELE